MNIAGLYRAMDEALPEQVNLEEKAGRLYFCLYRFHEWPDYTLFWIPIDFIEKTSVPVRCIVREFIRRFIRHHGLNMVKETWYYELALEELRDWKNRDPDASPQEVRRNSLLAESYDNGKSQKRSSGWRESRSVYGWRTKYGNAGQKRRGNGTSSDW